MRKYIQKRICIHNGDGVCNVTMNPKSFYADNVNSAYKVPCLYFNVEDK